VTTIAAALKEAARRGAQVLTPSARDRAAAFLASRIAPTGGVRGRGAGADLYYTVFGLGALAALGRPEPPARQAPFAAGFGDGGTLDLVHRCSLVRLLAAAGASARAGPCLARLEECRADDGAYALVPGRPAGTVTLAFLVWLARDDLGAGPPPRPDDLARALARARAGDGSFADAAGLGAGMLPATAAAAMMRRRLGVPDAGRAEDWIEARFDGRGFRAGARAPAPDLLSTAVGLAALRDAGRDAARYAAAAVDFVEDCARDDGGFAGHAADAAADAEYTWYALLALGAVAGEAAA